MWYNPFVASDHVQLVPSASGLAALRAAVNRTLAAERRLAVVHVIRDPLDVALLLFNMSQDQSLDQLRKSGFTAAAMGAKAVALKKNGQHAFLTSDLLDIQGHIAGWEALLKTFAVGSVTIKYEALVERLVTSQLSNALCLKCAVAVPTDQRRAIARSRFAQAAKQLGLAAAAQAALVLAYATASAEYAALPPVSVTLSPPEGGSTRE
jgi:hypothetical protein